MEALKVPRMRRPGHAEKFQIVMPGFMPGIHVLSLSTRKTWMAGTSPAMTRNLLRAFAAACFPGNTIQ
jgi:hypothetical protein